MPLRGVQFVINSNGNTVAVLLDLKEWGEVWEDIYDNLVTDSRKGEPTLPLDQFERELRAEEPLLD
jgi:hypothetical protein